MRRAVLLARRSAVKAPGGDSMQLEESAHVLADAGWDARVVATPEEARLALREGDVLHLWNAQRVWDWGDLPEHARRVGARLLVTPLLHPTEAYHRLGRRGVAGIAARIVRDPDQFAALRWGRGDLRARARAVLNDADAVLLAHGAEAEWLHRWCGADVRGDHVVPPAVPPVEPELIARPFPDDFVLCVGRIEPLKNPLAVLKAVGRLHHKVVFVGAVPRNRHLLHSRAFRAACQGAGSRWLGELSAGQVRGLMQQARVHVLASWTEVLGRVSVEAALAGCAVVTTDVGHGPALLGRHTPGLFLAPPGDERALAGAIENAWQFGRRTDGALAQRAEALTWARVAPALLSVYGPP